jgi:undecaprenyl diphosphate synthase
MVIKSFDYEVFGKVQHTGFRSSLSKFISKFNGDVSGKSINTKNKTVKGIIYYSNDEYGKKVKNWLQNIGSPSSNIKKCIIKNERINVKREIIGFEHNRKIPLILSHKLLYSKKIYLLTSISLLSILLNYRLKKNNIKKNVIKNNFSMHKYNKKNIDKISVIIPYLNEQNNILETLQKITNINIKGEIILVDNNSNDNTTEIVENFITNFESNILEIKNYYCHDIGKGNSLKVGFYNAKYDTIMITDADNEFDIYEYPKLIQTYKQLNEDYVELVANRNYNNHSYFDRIGQQCYNNLYKLLLCDNYTLSGTRIFPTYIIKKILHHNKLKAKKFGENFDISRGLHQYGKTFEYTNLSFKRRSIKEGRKMCGKNKIDFIKYSCKFLLKELFSKNKYIHENNIYDKKKFHIGIIPDGNRRYCKKYNKLIKLQHYIGCLKIKEIINYLISHPNIEYVTIYALSEYNWIRSKNEIDNILKQFNSLYLDYSKSNFLPNYKLNIISTNLSNFSQKLKNNINKIHKISNNIKNPKLNINLLLSYSGQSDIIQAAEKYKSLNNSKKFRDFLLTSSFPHIDLIIRTGNASRLSDFTLYDSGQSEFYFLNKYFPELTVKDIDDVIKDYTKNILKISRHWGE